MITIDGSVGEGGGQMLRSSLSLSMVTGQEIEIVNIRSRRRKPGLLRQHLTAVNASASVSKASVTGNRIGSDRLTFSPCGIFPGTYHFSVGSAGSTSLVLQAILPALLTAEKKSVIVIEGGTHNAWAPPFDFLEKSFVPIIRKMGADVKVEIEQYGFYPVGGGKIICTINPGKLKKISICTRGDVVSVKASALYSKLPVKIADDEITIMKTKLGIGDADCSTREVPSTGPGNAVLAELQYDNVCYVAAAFGQKNLPRQKVAEDAVQQVQAYRKSGAAVCEHLADQLLIPMAMAGGGVFRTVEPTMHMLTNIEIIKKFVNVAISIERVDENINEVKVEN